MPLLIVVLLSTGPSTSVFYLSVELSKKIVSSNMDSFPFMRDAMVGFCAQFFCGFVFTPRDVIKERLQVMNTYSNTFEGIKSIARAEGVRGFYRVWFLHI